MLKPAERRYALPMPTPRRGKRHRQIRRVFLARHLQKTQHAEMFRWQLHIMQREAPLREMPVEHGKTAGARARGPSEHAFADEDAPNRHAITAGDKLSAFIQTSYERARPASCNAA